MEEQLKKRTIIIILFIIAIVGFNIVINYNGIVEIIIKTLELWVFKVYPPIFIFFILSNLIINLKVFNNRSFFLNKLFKFQNKQSYSIFVISLLIGNPSTSALILENIRKKNINLEDGNNLLCVSSFLNPLFIYSILMPIFDINYILIIFFAHVFSNILIAIFLTNKNLLLDKKTSSNNDNNSNNLKEFFDSIEQANYILLKICGIMVISSILKDSVHNILAILNSNNKLTTILLSFVEVSSGLNDLIKLGLNENILILFITLLINFNGLSIILQVYSIIIDSGLVFKKFFLARLIQSSIGFFIVFIIINFNLVYFLIIILFVATIKVYLNKKNNPKVIILLDK